jgi:hypothetical protein
MEHKSAIYCRIKLYESSHFCAGKLLKKIPAVFCRVLLRLLVPAHRKERVSQRKKGRGETGGRTYGET